MLDSRHAPSRLAVLLLALGIDLALGELPTRFHPVAWVGRIAVALVPRAPTTGRRRQLAYGGMLTFVIVGLAGGLAELVCRAVRPVPGGRLMVGALLVSCSLSVRMLMEEALRVERSLRAGDDEGARRALRSLVSRDTRGLGPELLAAAAIESVAENMTDGIVAPALYHLAFGPSAAFAYRAANTLDSLIGYHGRYEYLGKAAARLDDAANVLPSRATALLLVAAARPLGLSTRGAWRVARRDHGRTESPNAGWPMAAMAGALGRRLEKAGHYTLGDGPPPGAADIRRSVRLVAGAVAVGTAAAALASLLRIRSSKPL